MIMVVVNNNINYDNFGKVKEKKITLIEFSKAVCTDIYSRGVKQKIFLRGGCAKEHNMRRLTCTTSK